MTTTHNSALHGLAVVTAVCTVLLLVAGALVTSNEAGLAVPDWPLSYGSVTPPMVGGILYEHSHRVIAAFVGVLTIALAAALWRSEPRRWVRRVGYAALGAVVVQGLLGGLTVLFFLPIPISVAHATLAQIFFGAIVSLALLSSRWWQGEVPRQHDLGWPALRTLASLTVAAVFLQLILGAALRHKGLGITPHLVGAAIVTLLVVWTAAALRRRFHGNRTLRNCSRGLSLLLGAQLLLGGVAWWSRLASRDYPQPNLATVVLTVMHTVFGALTLAGAVLVALISCRILRPSGKVLLASRQDVVGSTL